VAGSLLLRRGLPEWLAPSTPRGWATASSRASPGGRARDRAGPPAPVSCCSRPAPRQVRASRAVRTPHRPLQERPAPPPAAGVAHSRKARRQASQTSVLCFTAAQRCFERILRAPWPRGRDHVGAVDLDHLGRGELHGAVAGAALVRRSGSPRLCPGPSRTVGFRDGSRLVRARAWSRLAPWFVFFFAIGFTSGSARGFRFRSQCARHTRHVYVQLAARPFGERRAIDDADGDERPRGGQRSDYAREDLRRIAFMPRGVSLVEEPVGRAESETVGTMRRAARAGGYA